MQDWHIEAGAKFVRAMRKLREDGWLYRELAVKFKVALQTAQAVCNHLTWQHVD